MSRPPRTFNLTEADRAEAIAAGAAAARQGNHDPTRDPWVREWARSNPPGIDDPRLREILSVWQYGNENA